MVKWAPLVVSFSLIATIPSGTVSLQAQQGGAGITTGEMALPDHRKIIIGPEAPEDGKGPGMSALLFRPENIGPFADRLVVVMPGRGGQALDPHIKEIIKAYLKQGYAVLAVNPSHSGAPDTDGDPRHFTMTRHTEDLSRVLLLVLANPAAFHWTGENLALAGHSMGGYAAPYLASTRFRNIVKHVLLVNPVISGVNQLETRKKSPGGIEEYLKEVEQAQEDYPKHDIRWTMGGLTMPVAVVTGKKDGVTPIGPIEALYQKLPNPGGMAVIPHGEHCMQGPAVAAAYEEIIKSLPQNRDHAPGISRPAVEH